MQVDEVTRALRDGASTGHPPLDTGELRRRGRALRNRRRGWAAGAVLLTTTVVAGVVTGAVPGLLPGGSDDAVRIADTPRDTTLTPLERRVLEAMPAAYAADGTVVVPGPVDPDSEMNQRLDEDWLSTPPRPLGFHGFTDPGYLDSTVDYPSALIEKVFADDPDNRGVVADNGEVALACVAWEGKGECGPAVLVGDAAVGWFYLYGLGTDDFLRPDAEMEVFLDETYTRDGVGQSVIGGFDGTDAAEVVLTLVDGREVAATVDSGELSPGDTLFWSSVDGGVARVDAYDASGERVEAHEIRPCSDPVDCEVR
jgi:hypothetical protein